MELKDSTEARPFGWQDVLVEDLASTSENALATGPFGSSISSQFFQELGVPVIRGGNLRHDARTHLVEDEYVFVSEMKAAEFRRSIVTAGDLIFTCWGTINQVGLVGPRAAHPRYIISNKQMKLTPDPSKADSLFLFYLFSGPDLQRTIIEQGIGSSVPGFNLGQLRSMRVRVPGVAEQRAIAGALSDVDALLRMLERVIAKKRDLKQAAMQQLLTGKTRLPGFAGDWQTVPLGGLISHCFSGATPSRSRPDHFRGNIRWVTSGELNYNVITNTAERLTSEAVARTNLKTVPRGTFLMAITGLEAEGTRGSCGIVGEPSTTNQSCMAVFPTSELMTEYLFHYYVHRGKALALQYCQGTKQQSYTAKLVRLLPIALPPTIAEQAAIATALSDMSSEIAALEARLAKARAVKWGMMQELLTGRIRLV